LYCCPQIDTCNAYYCDGFKPNSHNKPTFWTENWDGWYEQTHLLKELSFNMREGWLPIVAVADHVSVLSYWSPIVSITSFLYFYFAFFAKVAAS
jgi:hypothetical protein